MAILNTTLLEEVFRHLSANEIKKCALVCSTWNDVIESSQVTMEKFKLRIRKPCTTLILRRRHRTLHIQRNRLTGSVGAGVKFDSSNVRSLSYEVLQTWWSMEELSSLLRQTPLLEQLHVNLNSTHIDTSEVAHVTLLRLKKLSIYPHNTLLKYIIAPQLVEFSYRGSTEDCTTIVEFMKIHTRIAKVETSAGVFMNILEHDFYDIRPTSLVIDKCLTSPTLSKKTEANFIKMLLNGSETLTSLVVCTSLISNKVLSVILNLKKLTNLRLIGKFFNGNNMMMTPSDSLRKLSIEHCDAMSILRNTPNITSLSIKTCDAIILNTIATCNKKLETLKMLSLKGLVADGVTFDNLKTLVCFFGSTNDFNQLKTHCPILTKERGPHINGSLNN